MAEGRSRAEVDERRNCTRDKTDLSDYQYEGELLTTKHCRELFGVTSSDLSKYPPAVTHDDFRMQWSQQRRRSHLPLQGSLGDRKPEGREQGTEGPTQRHEDLDRIFSRDHFLLPPNPGFHRGYLLLLRKTSQEKISYRRARRNYVVLQDVFQRLQWTPLSVQWTPLSRPKSGDPSLLFRQAVLAPTPYTSAGVR